MTEEEKKAIKIIEETHDMLVNPKLREEKYTTDDFEKAFYVVIMLIRKQQKEIEELNKNKQQINYNEIFSPDFVEENFISKDKIRKIINKYVDVDEHLEYANQELYGEDLRNMINELLKEE